MLYLECTYMPRQLVYNPMGVCPIIIRDDNPEGYSHPLIGCCRIRISGLGDESQDLVHPRREVLPVQTFSLCSSFQLQKMPQLTKCTTLGLPRYRKPAGDAGLAAGVAADETERVQRLQS